MDMTKKEVITDLKQKLQDDPEVYQQIALSDSV